MSQQREKWVLPRIAGSSKVARTRGFDPHKPQNTRPSRSPYKEDKIEQVRVMAMRGWTVAEMASFFEIDEKTFYSWVDEHPNLFKVLRMGREAFDERVEQRLSDKALDGDISAIKFWLANRRRKDWAERSEMSVEAKVDMVDTTNTRERALAVIAMLREAMQQAPAIEHEAKDADA